MCRKRFVVVIENVCEICHVTKRHHSAEREKTCQSLRKTFEEKCPKSWVKHFHDRRQYEAEKQRRLAGETK